MQQDLSLSGTYVMNDNTNRKQFFYGSQCYGTLFAIYMKINHDNKKITDIEFEIVNYKGLLNIGFLNSEEEKGFFVTKEDKILKIDFKIKAMTGQLKTTFIPENEILIKDIETIFGQRKLVKFANHTEEDYQNAIIFDEEFYHRNGNNEFKIKETRRGQDGYEVNEFIGGNCIETNLKVIQ